MYTTYSLLKEDIDSQMDEKTEEDIESQTGVKTKEHTKHYQNSRQCCNYIFDIIIWLMSLIVSVFLFCVVIFAGFMICSILISPIYYYTCEVNDCAHINPPVFWHVIPDFKIALDVPKGQYVTALVSSMMLILCLSLFLLEFITFIGACMVLGYILGTVLYWIGVCIVGSFMNLIDTITCNPCLTHVE